MLSEVIHGSVMSSEVIHGSVMSSEVIGSHPRISQVIFPKIDSIDLELFLKLNIFVLKPVGHREICNRYFYLKNRIPRGLDRRCQQNYAVLLERAPSLMGRGSSSQQSVVTVASSLLRELHIVIELSPRVILDFLDLLLGHNSQPEQFTATYSHNSHTLQ